MASSHAFYAKLERACLATKKKLRKWRSYLLSHNYKSHFKLLRYRDWRESCESAAGVKLDLLTCSEEKKTSLTIIFTAVPLKITKPSERSRVRNRFFRVFVYKRHYYVEFKVVLEKRYKIMMEIVLIKTFY